MADITEVFQKLVQRTNEGKVLWKSASDSRTFVAVVGNNSAMISHDDFLESKILTIFNSDGVVIETLDGGFPSDIELTAGLKDLYEQARHIALGVDETLAELLEELEKVE